MTVPATTIRYRSLRHWKYELLNPYTHPLPAQLHESGRHFTTPYLDLTADTLVIAARYAWDGASGPTFDSPSTMRASLVHDALYQLMRLGGLPLSAKRASDQLFYDLLREDGMGRFRAWYWLRGVRWFARVKRENGSS